ncbi:MAG: HAD family hydrolase [Candidatus Auribacterota bacterium]
MNNKPNFIFDWSGVISNDLDVVLQTYNLMFAEYGIAALSLDEFRNTFELPYENFCRRILGDEIDIAVLQDKFRQIYLGHNMTPSVIPGSEDVLALLTRRGVKMTILSSHSFVSREIERYFPGKNYFSKVYEDIPDKRTCIHNLLDEMEFDPMHTYYVGDMEHDIITGKLAGVRTIALTTGYRTKEMLEPLEPDHILDNLRDIVPLLNIC